MLRYLRRLAAALCRDLIDVIDALPHVRASGFDRSIVRQRISHVINGVVCAPHGPVAVVALVAQQPRVAVAGEIGDPEVGCIAAAIVLARPGGGMTVEHERLAIGRIVAVIAPVQGKRLLQSTVDADLVQDGNAREGAVATRRAEDHLLRVARPSYDVVAAGVIRQAARHAAVDRHDEGVVVAISIGRERDPLAVGGEAWIHLSRHVVGDAVRIAAVLVGGPDVAEIAEGDLSSVVIGVARQSDRRGGGGAVGADQEQRSRTGGAAQETDSHTDTLRLTAESYYRRLRRRSARTPAIDSAFMANGRDAVGLVAGAVMILSSGAH